MKYHHIRNFTGIETKFDSVKQDRGTLRRADGVAPIPRGALTTGPIWRTAWDLDDLAAQIATALTGATADKVHFVTITRSGHTLLVAWDMAAARPRGAAHVAGTGDPSFASTDGVTITAPDNSIYRDKTADLPWYAHQLDGRIALGNGTDTNLVWENGALALFGPSTTPASSSDPSRERFPPCTSFCQDERGVIYAAGNVTYPKRIWESDIPTQLFPQLSGVRSQAASYRDVVAESGASVVALRLLDGDRVGVHISTGGVALLRPARNGVPAGISRPATTHAAAINPNCVSDRKTHPFFLGADLELYRARRIAHPDDADDWRDDYLVTDRSSGTWNTMLARPASGADYFTIYDAKGGRLWFWATLNATMGSRQSLWCYDGQSFAITGPWRHPDLLAVVKTRDATLPGCIVAGITRDGALIYADLADVGERALPAYSDAIGADYEEKASAAAAAGSPGIPLVGVSADGLQFKQVLNGQTLSMSTPWADWAVADITATRFFKNAHLVVLEFSLEDFGNPAGSKDVLEILLQRLRNQRAYGGVYIECNGATDGKWLGTCWPEPQQIFGVIANGNTLRLRVIYVAFNDSPSLLSGVSVGYLSVGVPR